MPDSRSEETINPGPQIAAAELSPPRARNINMSQTVSRATRSISQRSLEAAATENWKMELGGPVSGNDEKNAKRTKVSDPFADPYPLPFQFRASETADDTDDQDSEASTLSLGASVSSRQASPVYLSPGVASHQGNNDSHAEELSPRHKLEHDARWEPSILSNSNTYQSVADSGNQVLAYWRQTLDQLNTVLPLLVDLNTFRQAIFDADNLPTGSRFPILKIEFHSLG
ncbi:hypothetical protein CEP54_015936 [Fusarium duplospermum]|uniref:Uncharacterized protein n=1 Tax=Fusarium duplospermum TaxID=1325734 RepID=A0A428NJU4_9HYPO|nr:hypothetical protein CEP54_015936 [Fusarium duplospermum]